MKIVHLLYAAPACEAGADGSVSMATGGSTASSKGSLMITQISTISFESMEKWMFAVCMKKQNAKVISTKDTLLELHNLVMLVVVSQQLAEFKTQEVKGTF